MRQRCSLIAAIGILLVAAAVARSATVTFDVRPVGKAAGSEVVVRPGTQVAYELVVEVASDTPVADNAGLSLFQEVHIQTGTGVTQAPLDAFSSVIVQYFTFGQSAGTATEDKITGIAAAQLGLGNPLFEGVGVGQATVIGTGKINTPTTEGTFTIKNMGGASASVVGVGSASGRPVAAKTVAAGPGFTIRTSNTAPSDGGSTDGQTQSSTSMQALGIAGAALLALMAAFWLGGPLGLLIALILVPLLGILALLNI